MIDEEEKQKYCEATKCEECTQWHHHCNAECCKTVKINIDPKELDKVATYLSIKPIGRFGLDDINYYKYRDVNYVRGNLRFRKDRLMVIGGLIYYFHPCSQLDNNLCLLHGKNKPEICKMLTLETAKLPGQPFTLTPNCLFKYKSKEVKQDD